MEYKYTLLLFYFFACTVVSQDEITPEFGKLWRCSTGNEVCYLHDQILPLDNRWLMQCFYSPRSNNTITVPPELKKTPGGTR